MTKKNNNSAGSMDNSGIAQYNVNPDKETPLWNPHSKVIYYWTSEPKNEKRAFMVAYNSHILSRRKKSGASYHEYRCVKK